MDDKVVVIPEKDWLQLLDDVAAIKKALSKPIVTRETKYLTVAEVAKKLKVAPLTVYRQIKAGKIPSKQVGSLIKIPSNYLDS